MGKIQSDKPSRAFLLPSLIGSIREALCSSRGSAPMRAAQGGANNYRHIGLDS
jgi:hypothetical protein